MKKFEFQTCVGPDATVTIPPEFASQIDPQQPVRVVVLLADSDEEQQWSNLTTEQFLNGYAEGDVIYDELSEG